MDFISAALLPRYSAVCRGEIRAEAVSPGRESRQYPQRPGRSEPSLQYRCRFTAAPVSKNHQMNPLRNR